MSLSFDDIPLDGTFGPSMLTADNTQSSLPISSGQPLTTNSEDDEIHTQHISPVSTKEVRLFDGTTISLKPKLRRSHPTTNSPESASVLDLSDLYGRANLHNSLKDNRARLQQVSATTTTVSQTQTHNEVLTEKYRPANFVQLCSAGNDKQYRSVLHWLKRWSRIVYGDEAIDEENNHDPYGRPFKRILLVHGPPGIGKTASVHVLAKQLGYSISELNASNSMDLPPGENSNGNSSVVGALKLKIINSLTSNSITGQGKPTCLVIDEIDSLTNLQDLIRVLHSLVQSDQRATNKRTGTSTSTSNSTTTTKTKSKDTLLSRPIICIANDIYQPGTGRTSPMERLRPLCEIINFKKPTASIRSNATRSIKDYIMKINTTEKYGLTYQQVSEIVELCDGDIRACLNYLQFNARKVDIGNLTSKLTSSTSGSTSMMDRQMSWYSVLNMLFKRYGHLSRDENFDILFNSFMNGDCRSVVSNSQLFDRVIRGCFNKYLDIVHLQDDSLTKPGELSDWLSYYDQTTHENYIGLVGLKIWSLFSEINPAKLTDESKLLIANGKNIDYESFELRKRNEDIITRVHKNLPIHTQMSVTRDGGLYFIPYLAKILTPTDLSSKLKSNLSSFEKSYIEYVTELIKQFGIKLENERDLDSGQVSLQFSPNWESLTQFQAINNTKHVQIKRQYLFPLIAAELDMVRAVLKPSKRINSEPASTTATTTTKRQKYTSSVDFFKSQYEGMNSAARTAIEQPSREPTFHKARIWVKYNEGFSNAVRKNIGWSDIWLP
ncbi:P-loop containing nucleoside triphosphate hydrolase protein [Scheffersomyces amazonensis]|uniref:P-loop containing nucleoside triphosphate hydrolase protein n=1 Tax=Scheffersomyces amazonensis TaxID=1078765 RepID=UPI00315C7694